MARPSAYDGQYTTSGIERFQGTDRLNAGAPALARIHAPSTLRTEIEHIARRQRRAHAGGDPPEREFKAPGGTADGRARRSRHALLRKGTDRGDRIAHPKTQYGHLASSGEARGKGQRPSPLAVRQAIDLVPHVPQRGQLRHLLRGGTPCLEYALVLPPGRQVGQASPAQPPDPLLAGIRPSGVSPFQEAFEPPPSIRSRLQNPRQCRTELIAWVYAVHWMSCPFLKIEGATRVRHCINVTASHPSGDSHRTLNHPALSTISAVSAVSGGQIASGRSKPPAPAPAPVPGPQLRAAAAGSA
jgi:hypothetical protein